MKRFCNTFSTRNCRRTKSQNFVDSLFHRRCYFQLEFVCTLNCDWKKYYLLDWLAWPSNEMKPNLKLLRLKRTSFATTKRSFLRLQKKLIICPWVFSLTVATIYIGQFGVWIVLLLQIKLVFRDPKTIKYNRFLCWRRRKRRIKNKHFFAHLLHSRCFSTKLKSLKWNFMDPAIWQFKSEKRLEKKTEILSFLHLSLCLFLFAFNVVWKS